MVNQRLRIKNLVKQELQRILNKEPPEELINVITEKFIKEKFKPSKFKIPVNQRINTEDVKHFVEMINIDELKVKY